MEEVRKLNPCADYVLTLVFNFNILNMEYACTGDHRVEGIVASPPSATWS